MVIQHLLQAREVVLLSGTSWPRAITLRRSCIFGEGERVSQAGDADDAVWLADVFRQRT